MTTGDSLKLLFLTGQSDRRSCALSPSQSRVAEWMSQRGFATGSLNFPYDPRLVNPARFNIVSASLSNGHQYLESRTRSFRARYRDAVIGYFDDHSPCLLLAGSCGLELYNNLELPQSLLGGIHVLAYGPVTRRVPERNVTVVQGRRDWVSRIFVSKPDYVVDCGHMDYLSCDGFLDLVLDRARALSP